MGDQGSIPGSGRSSGEGNGNPLQASCLKNPKDREAWRVTVHGVAKSRTQCLILYETPTDLGSSSFSVLSFCLSYYSWGSQGPNTEVVCHSLLQWTTFCQTSPPWPHHLGWPHMTWLSFTELDKLWSVWSDWLVVHDCGFSLSAPWPPLSVPIILLGFLLSWMWGISSQLLQQSAAAAPDLGCGVSPLACCSWPWTWGISSQLPLLTLDMGYLLTDSPDPGFGVSPLSCSWPWTWGSSSRRHSWPWMQGSSSWPLLTLDTGYLLSAATALHSHRSKRVPLKLAEDRAGEWDQKAMRWHIQSAKSLTLLLSRFSRVQLCATP